MLNPDIFKAYDIRGIASKDIDEKGAYTLARAFGVFLKERKEVNGHPLVVVASDSRESSPSLKEGLLKGLMDEGINVIDAGLTTTPMHYFSVNYAKTDGGIMITASHSPPAYNGFKLSLAGALPVGQDSGLEEIKKIALRNIFHEIDVKGKIKKCDFLNNYVDFLLGLIDTRGIKALSIAIDAGNGMTGIVLPRLLQKLSLTVQPLYFTIDMKTPRHEANPLKEETLSDLKRAVLKKKLDFGVAFDGDGDRIGFVDERGKFLGSDIVGAFLADWLLEKSKSEKIVYDLRSSHAVREHIENTGGIPIETRVGHAFIKTIMRREKAIFGMELSGHFYFRDFFYADSALLAFLYFLAAVSRKNKKLSEIAEGYKKYYSSGELNFKVAEGQETFLEEIATHFEDAKQVYWLDGLSVVYDNWWFNLRMSNTEPLVRLNIEAVSKKLLDEKIILLEKLILQ